MNKRDNRRNRNRQEESVEAPVEEVEVLELEEESEDTPVVNTPIPEVEVREKEVKVEVPEPKPVPVITEPKMNSDLEQKILIYIDKMKDTKGDEETGKIQYGFLQLMRSILRNPDPEKVRVEWNTLLRLANQNRHTVFNEMTACSGPNYWTGSEVEFGVFRRLMWVVLQTKDPKTRLANARTCVGEKTTEGLTQVERNNLLNLYS